MASNTDKNLRNQVIYSVYVRNHTKEGTFRALIPDLDRIRALGTDIIWFLPIHPIGVKGKKGSLGCPYANRDYRTVNPEYGTMEDFRTLVDAIHERGMKCIIDVVYNHTSPDSTLTKEHPEFFYHKPDGSMGNHVGDWTDVVDLDYTCRELWDYQIESLKMWAGIVDGFRCDVASFVPVDFWCRAREACEGIRPGCIWLAETVHSGFGLMARQSGLYSANDYEMFRAFDMEYDYDIREVFDRYLKGQCNLSNYIDVINFQECLYAGQEFCCEEIPSLFEKDVFPRDLGDISDLLPGMNRMKKEILSCEDAFLGRADDRNDIAILERIDRKTRKLGIFSLKGKSADISVQFPDGTYRNHLDGTAVCIENGILHCSGNPIVLTHAAE